MGLRDIESTLPPGFRFYPSDEELVCHYLYKKVANLKVYEGTMLEVDLHTREPWELPDGAKLSDNEWYFFSFRDRKYATGSRTNRATKSGYWKATGKDRTIYHPKTRTIVGMRKTLVFYSGRAPNGMKTGWVMHEFRLENPHKPPKEDWVLCRVFHKRKEEAVSSLENEQKRERELGCPPSYYIESSPNSLIDQSMPHGYCSELVGSSSLLPSPSVPHQHGNNINSSNNALLNLAVLHYSNNLLDFPQAELDPTAMMGTGMGSKEYDDDDDYVFLLDMGLDDDHGLNGIKGLANVHEDLRF